MGNTATKAKNQVNLSQEQLNNILAEFDEKINQALEQYDNDKHIDPEEICSKLRWYYTDSVLPNVFGTVTLDGIAAKLGLDVESWGEYTPTNKAVEYKKNICNTIANFYIQKINAVMKIKDTLRGCNNIAIAYLEHINKNIYPRVEGLSFKPGANNKIDNDRIRVARDIYKKIKELQKYTSNARKDLAKFIMPILNSRDSAQQKDLISRSEKFQGQIAGVCNSYQIVLSGSKEALVAPLVDNVPLRNEAEEQLLQRQKEAAKTAEEQRRIAAKEQKEADKARKEADKARKEADEARKEADEARKEAILLREKAEKETDEAQRAQLLAEQQRYKADVRKREAKPPIPPRRPKGIPAVPVIPATPVLVGNLARIPNSGDILVAKNDFVGISPDQIEYLQIGDKVKFRSISPEGDLFWVETMDSSNSGYAPKETFKGY